LRAGARHGGDLSGRHRITAGHEPGGRQEREDEGGNAYDSPSKWRFFAWTGARLSCRRQRRYEALGCMTGCGTGIAVACA
jgi:hypothetical protein